MPRRARIDAAGALHHIITIAPLFMMAQGDDRKPIQPPPLCSYGIILAISHCTNSIFPEKGCASSIGCLLRGGQRQFIGHFGH
jgi:hypothetical protein